MFDFLEFSFNQRALLAVIMIGFSNGALGSLVVLRKNSLVISALSHALLPGIALAMLVFGGMNPLVGLAGALFSALLVGLGTVYVARKGLLDHQTALSVLYTSAFAGGLLLLQRLPGNVELESWLFGNVLGLRNMDLWMGYGVSLVILSMLAWYRRDWILYLFEPAVAASMGVPVGRLNYLLTGLMVLALVTSLQAVGAAAETLWADQGARAMSALAGSQARVLRPGQAAGPPATIGPAANSPWPARVAPEPPPRAHRHPGSDGWGRDACIGRERSAASVARAWETDRWGSGLTPRTHPPAPAPARTHQRGHRSDRPRPARGS